MSRDVPRGLVRSRRSIKNTVVGGCERLESRRLLSVVLGGGQTVVPGPTIDVSAFANTPPSGDTASNQAEMTLAVNPTNPLNLVGFSHRLTTPIVLNLYRSIDGGTTWTSTQIDNNDDGLDALGNRYDPAAAFDANGTLYIGYGYRGQAVAPLRNSRVVAAASTDGGLNFVNFRVLDTQADIVTPSTTDTDLPGVDRWTLATGRDPNSGNQAAYITYTQNVTEGSSNDQRIVIAGTRDGGANWTAPATINDGSINGISAGGLGASPAVSHGGVLIVTWWDTGTTIMADRDIDGIWAGNYNFGTDITVRNDPGFVNVTPPAQPQRGARFSPSLTINEASGDLYLACHQLVSGNNTDILFGRSSNFGDTWTWTTVDAGTGTEFNPTVAWDSGSGALGIGYYSTEGDQATGNDDVRPRMALSTDNGNNWTRTFLSAQTSNEAGGYGGDYLEYNGFTFRDATAHYLWASRYAAGGTDLDAFTTTISLDSSTNNNVMRLAGFSRVGGDTVVIRRAPANGNYYEVIENGVRTDAGLLASIDSITIETFGGTHAFNIDNLPAIPVTIVGTYASGQDTTTINSLSGVSRLTVTEGSGNDTLNLAPGGAAGAISSPITYNGGTGDDTLNLGGGNLDVLTGTVTFDGTAGFNDRVYLNDQSTTAPYGYNISATSVQRDGAFAGLIYANLDRIVLNCGSGDNNISQIIGAVTPIEAHGNGGFDTITLNDSTSSTGKPWNINPDQVIVNGALTSTEGFEGVGILAGSGADQITFSGGHSQSFNVDAGGGADTITVGYLSQAVFASTRPIIINGGEGNDGFVWQRGSNNWGELIYGTFTDPVTLNGGGGYNTLSVDDTTRGNTSYQFYTDRFYAYEPAAFPAGADFTYDGMQAIGLSCSDGSNALAIRGVSSDIDVGNQVSIALGGGADTATVFPHDAGGNLTINGNLGIGGGAGSDTITLDDTGVAAAASYSLSNPFGAGTQNISGLGSGGFGYASDFENATIKGGNGNDTFSVNQYKAGTPLGIYGGGGDDTLHFGNNNIPLNITSIAAFGFDGQGGFNRFVLDNTADAGNWTYTRNISTIGAIRSGYGGVTLSDANVQEMTVNAGPGADLFYVRSLAAGTSTILNANGGSDSLVLADTTQNLSAIQGLVGYNAGAAGGNMYVYDNADTSGDIAHLTAGTLGAARGDNLFGPGGSLSFSGVTTVGSFPGLTLNLGSGADIVFAAPLAAAKVTINAGSPAELPADQLNLALAAAQAPVISGTPTSGNVASANLQTLTWTGFESGPNIDAVAPAVLAADINLDGIAAAALAPARQQTVEVRFSETMGLIGTPSLSLTNLTTGQVVPQTYIAETFDDPTNTARFTFPGYPGGILPDGNYQGTVLAANTSDYFGNALAADVPFSFFSLSGDANHDRAVDISDLGILATNWQGTNKTFAQADFNYDGVIDISDLGILATNWQKTLAAPSSPAMAGVSLRRQVSAAPRSPFSATLPLASAARRSLVEDVELTAVSAD